MNEQLINYIKENLARGIPKEQIRQSLLTNDWKAEDIDIAFGGFPSQPSLNTQSDHIPTDSQKKSPLKKILIVFLAMTLLIIGIIVIIHFAFPNFALIKISPIKENIPAKSSNVEDNVPITNLSADFKLKDCIKVLDKSLFPKKLNVYGQEFSRLTSDTDLDLGIGTGVTKAQYADSNQIKKIGLTIASKERSLQVFDNINKHIDNPMQTPNIETEKKQLFGEDILLFWSKSATESIIYSWEIYTTVNNLGIEIGGTLFTNTAPDIEPTYKDWVSKVCR